MRAFTRAVATVENNIIAALAKAYTKHSSRRQGNSATIAPGGTDKKQLKEHINDCRYFHLVEVLQLWLQLSHGLLASGFRTCHPQSPGICSKYAAGFTPENGNSASYKAADCDVAWSNCRSCDTERILRSHVHSH